MILRSERVAELLRKGEEPDAPDPLVITPKPDLIQLEKAGSASVDLHLGTWFLTLRPSRMTHMEIDSPGSHVQFTKTHYVSFGDQYILHPRSFVLGITAEWIRMPRNLAAYLIGRSSWGRRGLIIATAAGIHPGYCGCLTLELSNVGEIPMAISPGIAICQLFLHDAQVSDKREVDVSQFIGMRKPTVGKVEPDELARRLASVNP
jgi:dCTP deaminase